MHDTEIDWLRKCQSYKERLNGFPYDAPLLNADGVFLYLFVPLTATNDEIRRALHTAYKRWDVVNHTTIVCPENLFPKTTDRSDDDDD